MEAYVTNNNPRVIAGYYLRSVINKSGCPKIIRSDRGTENVHVNRLQEFLREDDMNMVQGNCTTRIKPRQSADWELVEQVSQTERRILNFTDCNQLVIYWRWDRQKINEILLPTHNSGKYLLKQFFNNLIIKLLFLDIQWSNALALPVLTVIREWSTLYKATWYYTHTAYDSSVKKCGLRKSLILETYAPEPCLGWMGPKSTRNLKLSFTKYTVGIEK